MTKRYVTFNIQKDKRINLGYAVHKYKDCPSLKGKTNIQEIEGSIVQAIPKYFHCYNRQENESK